MANALLRSETVELPRLALRASFEPSTINVEARTVDVTWTTGARVLRGYYDQYWEELSLDPKHVKMGRLQSGTAPLLDSHRSGSIDDIIGVVESARLAKGEGTATVRFDSGVRGEDAFRRVREGTLRNLSVGYSTYKMQKIEDGATTTPVYRAVDWEPYELTFAPMGADAGAVTRSAGGMTPCEFIQERDMADSVPTATPTTTPAIAPAPALVPAPAPDLGDQARAAATAERERVLGIQRVGRTLSRPSAEVDAAVASGTTLEAFRAAAVEAQATAQPEGGGVIPFDRTGARVDVGDDRREKFARGAVAWIAQRAGVAGIIAAHAKAAGFKVELDPGEFRGLRMIDLARMSLELAGVRTGGMLPMDLVGKALTMRAGGMSSTSDFPYILENVLGKTMLAQYVLTADTWSRFCKTGTIVDFRASKRYRPGSFGALDAVGEGGEFKNKAIPDAARESLTGATKGNIIAITRQAIINDDMGAFDSLATGLGRAAKLTIELDVYALLALNAGLGPTMGDGVTMFHANHGNLTAGAALSAAALDADRVAMGTRTDVSGNELLDLSPAILVVAKALGGQARVINDSPFDPDTLANKAPNKANIAGKMFRDIVDTGRITGTRRYLFADPADAPCIEVAFLDGQQEPFLDAQNGWRTDGAELKVRLDYGVAGIDWRGAVTNAGA